MLVQCQTRAFKSNANETRKIAVNWLTEHKGIDPDLVDEILKSFPTPNPSVKDIQQLGDAGLNQLIDAVIHERADTLAPPSTPLGDKESKDVSPAEVSEAFTAAPKRAPVYVRINIIPPRGNKSNAFPLVAREGDTLQTLQDRNGLLADYMECTCGGIAACSTCHVYIPDPKDFKKLPEPEESELDLLDLAVHRQDNSRLGCQITLTRDLQGITFQLPDEVVDLH